MSVTGNKGEVCNRKQRDTNART